MARLAAQPHSEAIRVWFELWQRELEAMQRDAECAKRKRTPCREAEALRRQVYHGFETQLGAPGNAVLLRGALPSSAFEAGFRFTIESGLEALVGFDPSFLAVGLPKRWEG